MAGIFLVMAGAAASADSIVGVTWHVEIIEGAGTVDTGQTAMTITDQGAISTTIGCNRIFGQASIDGRRLSIGPLASTRMACAPLLVVQEKKYADALAATRSFQIDGRFLRFIGEDGAMLVTYVRAP